MPTLQTAYSAFEYSQFQSLVKELSCLHDEDEALRRPMQDMLRRFLELTMRLDLIHYLQAGRYQRRPERTGYRNGSYHRSLVTSFGTVPRLTVPRPRKGGVPAKVFRRYKRRWRQVEAFIRKLFLSGVSTRETGAVLAGLLATRPNASSVSNNCKTPSESGACAPETPANPESGSVSLGCQGPCPWHPVHSLQPERDEETLMETEAICTKILTPTADRTSDDPRRPQTRNRALR